MRNDLYPSHKIYCFWTDKKNSEVDTYCRQENVDVNKASGLTWLNTVEE